MIRNTLIAANVFLAVSTAVLWPVSYWWYSTWYDTIQTAPLAGYWCGYALVDGNLIIQWDSPKPPTVPPMGVMTLPSGGFNTLDDQRVQFSPETDGSTSSSGSPSGGGKTPLQVLYAVQVFYGDNNTFELAFWGWKLEYDRVLRMARIDTPLPMLAFLFALFSLLLGIRGPLLRRRRRKRGLCVKCEYDLTANVSGTCPECGTPI